MAKQAQKKNKSSPAGPRNWIWFLLIFALAFVLYGNTFKHSYTLDDDIYCLKNKFSQQGPSASKDIFFKGSLLGFNGEKGSQYRPIPLFNFAVEIAIFKNNTVAHHFFNVLLYALCCMVLYLLLQKLFRNYHYTVPLIIALLFLAHPLHTDVVPSIKSRDELWAFFFGISSFYLLMRYIDSSQIKWMVLSGISFFFSTLSKESSLMFTFIFPLILFFFTGSPLKKIVLTSLPFALIAGVYAVLRMSVLTSVAIEQEIIVMNNALMAARDDFPTMLASNFVILLKYLWLMLVPYNLSWDYSYNSIPIQGWMNIKPILSLLLHLGLVAYVIIRFRKKDPVVFGILFYFFMLVLASNLFVKINSTMAERFLFAPSLGFCIALVVAMFKVLKLDLHAKHIANTMPLVGITTAILLLYSVKVISRNPVWKNNLSLFESGIKNNPGSARTWYALSGELKGMGDKETNPVQKEALYNRSMMLAQKGLEIYPDADMYYNLGTTLYSLHKQEEALTNFRLTVQRKPKYAGALNNMGVIWFERQKYDSAGFYFAKAIEVDSTFSDGFSNLGATFQNTGKRDQAIPLYEKALRYNPANGNARSNLSKIYFSKGDTVQGNRVLKGG